MKAPSPLELTVDHVILPVLQINTQRPSHPEADRELDQNSQAKATNLILLKNPAEDAVSAQPDLVIGFCSMSLPQFDLPGSLFEDVGSIVPALFDYRNKYQLFAQKVWPVLVGCREQLAECYTPDNGRPAVEPVVLLGVLILQFLERVPDRQAVELVKYHLGWKLALEGV